MVKACIHCLHGEKIHVYESESKNKDLENIQSDNAGQISVCSVTINIASKC